MTDEKILATILTGEGLATYDETGNAGNIFISKSPETLQNDIDYLLMKTGGGRVIRKLTGAKNSFITIYARGKSYELISESLDKICSTLLNKSYKIEYHFVENIFVQSEPSWLSTDDNGNHLFNTTLILTII